MEKWIRYITEEKLGVAARHQGSLTAMEAAYRSGQVFIGDINLPIIDVRHYLEQDLDMHHVSASFYSRLRIEASRGHANNHVIWISHKDHNPVNQAFKVMDDWLLTAKSYASEAILSAKPLQLKDACFDEVGNVIASGAKVWDGVWNSQPEGTCQQAFPMFSTSRIESGAAWAGDMFKCSLIPIKNAAASGLYGDIDMSDYIEQLEKIFPTGVCDYTQKDIGRPTDI